MTWGTVALSSPCRWARCSHWKPLVPAPPGAGAWPALAGSTRASGPSLTRRGPAADDSLAIPTPHSPLGGSSQLTSPCRRWRGGHRFLRLSLGQQRTGVEIALSRRIGPALIGPGAQAPKKGGGAGGLRRAGRNGTILSEQPTDAPGRPRKGPPTAQPTGVGPGLAGLRP